MVPPSLKQLSQRMLMPGSVGAASAEVASATVISAAEMDSQRMDGTLLGRYRYFARSQMVVSACLEGQASAHADPSTNHGPRCQLVCWGLFRGALRGPRTTGTAPSPRPRWSCAWAWARARTRSCG